MTLGEKVAMAFKGRKAIDKLFDYLQSDPSAEGIEALQDMLSRHLTALTHVRYFAGKEPLESLDGLIEHYEGIQDSLYNLQ